MKKLITVIFTLCFMTSVQATEVAVLDFRAALLQSNIGQEAAKEPKQKVAAMDARLKSEQESLEADANNLKRDELTLSEEEFKKRRAQLAENQNKIRNMAANMQRQAKELEQQLIQSLTPKGEAALKLLIEERKLDLVLNRQLSLYASGASDITDELVERINKDN
ncbi:MAG: OmpH family outer membrane protein [Marinomonas foliarum]|jgi:outer membrane protein|uniref:OmpH family outer membrane protein n=1 Tax=Marinomonas foliarum TaxID=491950 RepID=A0A369AIA7_9GAMM|nr:OmpH family outer membrane protein [Marinomonas foliarum]QRV24813.1 OmpH family outer membrane protein [Marinomonas foliarum]RCX08068.1 periplasmic chaperone for outer membrane proteins Skp [Marinomonas foliarum]